MQLFKDFFRMFGIRRLDGLQKPKMATTQALDLPQYALYHYQGSNSMTDQAPSGTEYLFRNINRPIMMEHVTEFAKLTGNARKQQIQLAPHVRTYHARNQRYKLVKSFDAFEKAGTTMTVVNYGFLASLVKYPRVTMTPYFQWYNQQYTIWSKIAEIAKVSVRNQFIKYSLPTVLPSISDLKFVQGGMTQSGMSKIHEPEAFFILEVWKWLGEFRESSMLNLIPRDRLDRVNLIFEESGRFTVINLADLDKWRAPNKTELAATPDLAKQYLQGIDQHQLQKRFLHMLVILFQARSVDGKIMELEGDPKKEEGGEANSPGGEDSKTTQDAKLPKVNPQTDAVNLGVTKGALPGKGEANIINAEGKDEEPHDGPNESLLPEAMQRRLDADLAELERISKAAQERRAELQVEMVEEHDEAPQANLLALGAVPVKKPENLETPAPKPVASTLFQRAHGGEVQEHDYTAGVKRVIDLRAEQGMISAAESRRYQELARKHESITAPDGKTPLHHFVRVAPEMVQIKESPAIPDKASIIDKTMLKSSLHTFDTQYVKDVMQRDVAAMVLNMQNAGICVTEYESERVESIMGDYDMYTIRVVPIEGAPSTLRFKLPAVQEDGTYTSNGVKYRIRKQRGEMPIVKIEPDTVALTSYYGKLFVNRSEKKVNDYGNWLRNQVMSAGLDEKNFVITELQTATVFDGQFEAPRLYSILAQGMRSFWVNLDHLKDKYPDLAKHSLYLNFDHTKRESLLAPGLVKLIEGRGKHIVVGYTDKKIPIVMNLDGSLQTAPQPGANGTTAKPYQFPDFEELIGAESAKAPVDFAVMMVLGRSIPVGVALAYEMGLAKLIEALGVTPRRVPAGKRVGLMPDEYSLVFADETLVFSRADKFAALFLAGFNEYHRGIKQYSVYEFDRRGVYLNILESSGASARYLRELDLLNQMFVDPITRELLADMKEPVEFQPLIIRATEMLLTDTHPRKGDGANLRIKGYERLAGAVYTELVKSIQAHNGKAGKSKQPIDLHPFAVWKRISEDPSKNQVKDINPVENLKQQEAVTYNGTGGRNSRSMTKATRIYDRNDMGTISESTVDSSDVAVNTYLSADPQFVSLRGVSKRYEIGKTGATALLSTSALLSVAADRDDPKRVNFIGIQHGHGVACAGYHASHVRTGYEQVIAHRTSDLFAFTAKKPGKVVSITEHGMVVEYEDGTKKGIELGRRYGNAEGATIPHDVTTDLKVGDKFKVGDLLSYNTGFFERDFFDPSQVVWKAGTTVTVALMESPLTLEDSSAISQKTADLLMTKTSKVREIIVNFKQSISHLVKVGQTVESGNILCVIEDAATARNELFDEKSIDTLRLAQAMMPPAKFAGTVERIEVFYHGEKEDMTDSLRAIANASDRELAARHKAVGRSTTSGAVDESFRSEGNPLNLDTLAIKITITADVPAGVGDKGVFGNQMKTVFGKVLEDEVTTESGQVVDAIFGQKSISDRIVTSPEVIGTTTVLLELAAQRALKAYGY